MIPTSAVLRGHDACGILGGLTRRCSPVDRFVRMLDSMSHRGGDGLGVLFRIPREVLEAELPTAAHRDPSVVTLSADLEPLVLTLQVPSSVDDERVVVYTRDLLDRHGLALLYAMPVSRPTRDAERVRTWRVVAHDAAPTMAPRVVERMVAARRDLEARAGSDGLPPSFSPVCFSAASMVLYKQVGNVDDWFSSFGGESLDTIRTDCCIAHVRYSTNTLPMHRSAQPFGLLAHNGEINNIGAIRRAMGDRGIPLSPIASDSADLSVLTEELCVRHRLELPEALQLLFPRRWAQPDGDAGDAAWHTRMARVARPIRAEGPAALVATDGHGLVGRLDSLGLRPLALVETTDSEVFFTSEVGAVAPLDEVERIHQLRPGEMIAVYPEAAGIQIIEHADLESRMRERHATHPEASDDVPASPMTSVAPEPTAQASRPSIEQRRAVAGLSKRMRRRLEGLFLDGHQTGSGTGWRGGFAVARGPGARLADAFQAMTAQVTAPTLSAEHEMAAMDGRVVLGAAEDLGLDPEHRNEPGISLDLPFVIATEGLNPADLAALGEAASRLGILSLTQLRARAGRLLVEIDAHVDTDGVAVDETGATRIRATLDRVRAEAVAHAESGECPLLLLRCTWGADPHQAPLPPELVVGAVDQELTRRRLRHRVSLLIASDAISDPHRMFVLLQLGADALVPTLLCEEALILAEKSDQPKAETIERGLAAIAEALFIMYGRIATSEIAAGRGGRRLCALGLDAEIRELIGLTSAVGTGQGLAWIWQGLQLRSQAVAGEASAVPARFEAAVDTMPLDAALGGYALLGGFTQRPDSDLRNPSQLEVASARPPTSGQLRMAARTVAESLERQQRVDDHDPDTGPPTLEWDDPDQALRLVSWVEDLPLEQAAELHLELFAPLRAGAHGFMDSLRLRLPPGSRAADWEAVETALDGRRNNQILGAISYGANNRFVHELYALVMARCGAMSNGGEGGVPDHVRALFVTARLAARGAGPPALARQLVEEAPTYVEGLDTEQRTALCRRLLDTVPADFAASRFEQISTGRFGVDAYAFHDARFLEIKIGQGAKPGVGGSLPGEKVHPAIAATRGVNVGQTLNSPTVHHDIYSIEDLRQLVTALKTLNREARVCVKLAAMDDLDIVALGVVKAGADFLWIDGYEGGTGSAKNAHKEHCGLPAAPVLQRVHRMLLAQRIRGGYRHTDEPHYITRQAFHRLDEHERTHYRWHGPRIIGSGGVRNAEDALKLVLAGADYVGYGDAAQNAVGCIRCEKCHTGSCPVYVATNDPRRIEAFDTGGGAATLTRFVQLIDVGMRKLASAVAPDTRHVEELVGRTDLLLPAETARLRIEPAFFEAPSEGDPTNPFRLEPGRDSAAVRRPSAQKLEKALAVWRGEIHEALADQGLDPTDPNGLDELGPAPLELPGRLRRLECEVDVDNRDRLLGTGLVHDFVELRRLARFATGTDLELAVLAHGAAGSGFGMFAVHGMDLTLVGNGGDYLGEAINGARLVVLPARAANGRPLPGSGTAGSASVYGMRGGEVHLFEQPGTRFGIRLSGGIVYVWGDPEGVEASFDPSVMKPQFTGEYMTRGTLVLCRDPGLNLLHAATGQDTEILCRKPEALGRDAWARILCRRIPSGFEVLEISPRHAALVEYGARTYQQRAHGVGIDRPVTPILPGEDPHATFLLLRERRDGHGPAIDLREASDVQSEHLTTLRRS